MKLKKIDKNLVFSIKNVAKKFINFDEKSIFFAEAKRAE